MMSDLTADAVLGLDIGGANLKAFHTVRQTASVAFPMWLRPRELANEIGKIASRLPSCRTWGITMTGEMADVFVDRAEGVRFIAAQVMAAADVAKVRDVRFYTTLGHFVGAAQAVAAPERTASANWHALATWVSSWIECPGLLVDIGSTTTDLIPVSPGRVDTPSQTDHDRLCRGELVYVGIRRTPVCGIVDRLPMGDSMVPVMKEHFASTDDCALILGWVPEDEGDADTCDARARLIGNSVNRLARMIGLGQREVSMEQAKLMATHVLDNARALVAESAARHHAHAKSLWIISGHGDCLIPVPPGANAVYLSNELDKDVARVAPAYAVAQLITNGLGESP